MMCFVVLLFMLCLYVCWQQLCCVCVFMETVVWRAVSFQVLWCGPKTEQVCMIRIFRTFLTFSSPQNEMLNFPGVSPLLSCHDCFPLFFALTPQTRAKVLLGKNFALQTCSCCPPRWPIFGPWWLLLPAVDLALEQVERRQLVKHMFWRSQLCTTCCDPLAIFRAQGGKVLEARLDMRGALAAGVREPSQRGHRLRGWAHTPRNTKRYKFFAARLRLATTPPPATLCFDKPNLRSCWVEDKRWKRLIEVLANKIILLSFGTSAEELSKK